MEETYGTFGEMEEEVTELSFLLDLLLNEKLSKSVKNKIKDRVGEVEKLMTVKPFINATIVNSSPLAHTNIPAHLQGQSPATIAKMMTYEDQGKGIIVPPITPPMPTAALPEQPQQTGIAATNAVTMGALANREQMIANAVNGKPPSKNRNFK